MKRFFAMLFCFGLVAALGAGIVGCDKKPETKTTTPPTTTTTPKTTT